jgi:hypothetical protein
MALRIFWGFVLGTIVNFAFFGAIATANGTPVPSVHSPVALLTYPTGSVAATVGCAWVIYAVCLVITCGIFPRRNTPAR